MFSANQRPIKEKHSTDITDVLDGVFHCPNKCGRKYGYKTNLVRHLKYQCGVPKQFACSLCSNKFSLKQHYRTHMLLLHKLILD